MAYIKDTTALVCWLLLELFLILGKVFFDSFAVWEQSFKTTRHGGQRTAHPYHLSTQGAISPEPECPGLQCRWHPWSRGGLGGVCLQSIGRSQGHDWGWGWGVLSASFLKAEITGLEHSLPWLLPPSEHEEWNCSLNSKQAWSSKTGRKWKVRRSTQCCYVSATDPGETSLRTWALAYSLCLIPWEGEIITWWG